MGNYSIRKTDSRERQYQALCKATGENSTSKAIDKAVRYYLRMAGGNAANPHGTIRELMQAAHTQGNLTADEIADILDSPELGVSYQSEISIQPE